MMAARMDVSVHLYPDTSVRVDAFPARTGPGARPAFVSLKFGAEPGVLAVLSRDIDALDRLAGAVASAREELARLQVEQGQVPLLETASL